MAGVPQKGVKPRGTGYVAPEGIYSSARKWKYLAQRALTGVWLDRTGIPVLSDTLTWDLKTGSLQGTINPDYYGLKEAGTNHPLMDEWATYIYAECDGSIEWGGILTLSDFTGPDWQFQCTGFRGYPSGQIFNEVYSYTNVDPFDAVTALWDWMQQRSNGNLGVQLRGNVASTPVRLGTLVNPTDFTPSFPRTNQFVKNTSGWPVTISWYVPGGGTQIFYIDINGKRVYDDSPHTPPNMTLPNGQSIVLSYTVPGLANSPQWKWMANVPVPFALDWWNGTDIGQELDQLALVTPFDFTETHNWNSDKSDVLHYINMSYPRVGTRKSDLRFVEGENIVVMPSAQRDGTQYANAVVAFGAGSGSSTLRWASGLLDSSGKLHRSYAYTNASIKDAAKLQAAARRDALTKYQLLTAQTITVADHPHAPFGSFREGDDILVQFTSGWLKGQAIWHRVTSYNYSTISNSLVLTLARSDSFSYATGDLSTI